MQLLRLQLVHLVRYMLACTSADSDVFWRMMNTRWHVFQHMHHYSIKVCLLLTYLITGLLAYLLYYYAIVV